MVLVYKIWWLGNIFYNINVYFIQPSNVVDICNYFPFYFTGH